MIGQRSMPVLARVKDVALSLSDMLVRRRIIQVISIHTILMDKHCNG